MRTRINQLKKQLRNERGLTLVELLAVIVILAIVAIIAFVFIGGVIENSKKDAHIANAQQVISAAKLHEATGGFSGDETSITVAELQKGNYLEDEMLDPWKKSPYVNALNATVKKIEGGNQSEDKVFEISGFEDEEGNCKINGETESSLSKKDRKDLCD